MQQISLCSTHRREQRKSVPKGCSTCTRINIERDIVLRTVAALLAAGYWLVVDDGASDYRPERPTRNAEAITAELMETDDDFLVVFREEEDVRQDAHIGWVRFVYGNDGYDVINDYTTNLEDVLAPVLDYVEKEYQ